MSSATIRLTMAQAVVRWLTQQFTEIESVRVPLFAGVFGIFGHGNVTCFSEALEAAQDRLTEKRFFERLGIPTPVFVAVERWDDLRNALNHMGLPAVLKTRRFGYDGKGQVVIRKTEDVSQAWLALGGVPLILEGFVAFDRELSQIAVRGSSNACAAAGSDSQ